MTIEDVELAEPKAGEAKVRVRIAAFVGCAVVTGVGAAQTAEAEVVTTVRQPMADMAVGKSRVGVRPRSSPHTGGLRTGPVTE